jgi:hypothetical protein
MNLLLITRFGDIGAALSAVFILGYLIFVLRKPEKF